MMKRFIVPLQVVVTVSDLKRFIVPLQVVVTVSDQLLLMRATKE